LIYHASHEWSEYFTISQHSHPLHPKGLEVPGSLKLLAHGPHPTGFTTGCVRSNRCHGDIRRSPFVCVYASHMFGDSPLLVFHSESLNVGNSSPLKVGAFLLAFQEDPKVLRDAPRPSRSLTDSSCGADSVIGRIRIRLCAARRTPSHRHE